MAVSYKRPLRAAIYCRISLATHGDTVKVKRQEKLCRKLAKRLGWTVIRVYCDNNKSAWQRNRKRPDWDEMLLAIQNGELDAVIIYHGDRLIRQPWDLETLLSLADGRGIRLASPSGTRNLDDPDDRYRLRQDAAKACNESDTIARRTRDSHADNAAKGKPHKGGFRSFGYGAKGKKIVDAEAEEYRKAVARILAGESKTSVLRDWNRRGIWTTRGNPWCYSGFSKMLTKPRYAGLAVYKGEVVGKGKWKELVDRETWEALQLKLSGNAEKFGPAAPSGTSKYLLTGIAVHPECGSTVKAFHGTGGPAKLSYLCSDRECTAKVRRNMENLDVFVIGRVLRRLADSDVWDVVEAEAPEDNDGVELEALQRKRQDAVATFENSETMSAEALNKTLRRIDERIAGVRSRIAARQRVHVLAGCRNMTREQWDELPLDRRRALVRALLKIEVFRSRRGPGFDVNSVQITPLAIASNS